MIVWARNTPEHSSSKLDDAIDRGYDPHPDDNQPAAAWIEADIRESGHDALDWFTTGIRALHIVGPLTRCTHPHCRTSVTEESVSFCPHDLPFCEACVWEDGCDDCANGQPNDYKEAS